MSKDDPRITHSSDFSLTLIILCPGADEVTKMGTVKPVEEIDIELRQSLRMGLSKKTRLEWLTRWRVSDRHRQTKLLWNENKTQHNKMLLKMSRGQLRMVTNLITGHNTLGSPLVRLTILVDNTCRWCGEAVEDSYHFL